MLPRLACPYRQLFAALNIAGGQISTGQISVITFREFLDRCHRPGSRRHTHHPGQRLRRQETVRWPCCSRSPSFRSGPGSP